MAATREPARLTLDLLSWPIDGATTFTHPDTRFLSALTLAHTVADKRATMPVLANVLLDARDGTVTVSGTNLFLAVQGSALAEVKRSGSVAVPARGFLDRIQMMPEGPLRLVSDDGTTVVADELEIDD